MSIFNVAPTTFPSQQNGAGSNDELKIEEYAGKVEGTIERRSILKGMIPMRPVRGTNTITNYAVGEATLGKVVPGQAPDPTGNVDFSKASLTVDTLVYARNAIPLLEQWQTRYDARSEIGTEHGKKIAKFYDNSFLIQGAKAATAAQSKFSNGTAGKPAGHKGGSVETLAAAADRTDPAKLLKAISNLFVKMEQKDVVPQQDDIMIVVRPAEFYALQDAEQIINGTYVTANGTTLSGVPIFKTYGCPVYSSMNLPQEVITGHLLSNAGNGNAYDGDFSKLVALAMAPQALLAGETIGLASDVYYERKEKMWYVDSHMSYGVTTNRHEYAGAIMVA